MKVVITGEGYPPVLERIFPQEGNITFFRQPPEVKRFPSKKGITYRVTYTMAISHAKSFDLSALALHAFNPRTETSYLLEIPEQHFEIHHKDRSVLLDAVDNPLPFHLDFTWFLSFLGYLTVFAAGYLSARIVKRKKQQQKTQEHPFEEKIRSSKDAKTLLQVLMAADRKTFSPQIEALENGLYRYREAKMDLKKIKQSALEKLL